MSANLAQAGLAQRAFSAALFDPATPVPEFVRESASPRAASAFAVYRNNVAASLTRVLTARFPVIVRLIGEHAFCGLALRFIAHEPPRSPVLIDYGSGFPDFLGGLAESAMAQYLADIARLEVARGRAYHSADAEPLAAARFAEVAPDRLPQLQVLLHPSLTLLRSRFPVVSAWEANQPGADMAIRQWQGEDALVFRPHDEVLVVRLAAGGFAFFEALSRGAALSRAIEAGIADDPAFDLAANLALLAGSGAAVGLGGNF